MEEQLNITYSTHCLANYLHLAIAVVIKFALNGLIHVRLKNLDPNSVSSTRLLWLPMAFFSRQAKKAELLAYLEGKGIGSLRNGHSNFIRLSHVNSSGSVTPSNMASCFLVLNMVESNWHNQLHLVVNFDFNRQQSKKKTVCHYHRLTVIAFSTYQMINTEDIKTSHNIFQILAPNDFFAVYFQYRSDTNIICIPPKKNVENLKFTEIPRP